jgi:hypothetical protein
MFSPAEGEEHSTKLLKIFSQEAEQEMTAALEPAAEEEADIIDFVDLCEELEALERRVIVQILHIQQVKLEIDGGSYQPEEQLEEDGDVLAEELTETNMSEGEAEQQFSKKTAELKSAVEWKTSATRGDEDNMGDQVDLLIDKYGEEEVQQRRLHKKSQPLEQLDEVIEEIRKMMLRSVEETINKEKLSRRDPAIAAGKQQQQQQQSRGVGKQLQEKVWDPGGFQRSWRAHEQELMNFSQQWSMMQEHISTSIDASTKQHVSTHLEIRRGVDPLIFKIRIIKFCKFMCKSDTTPKPCPWTGVDQFIEMTDCKQVQIFVRSGSLFNVMSHRLRCLNETVIALRRWRG